VGFLVVVGLGFVLLAFYCTTSSQPAKGADAKKQLPALPVGSC
jgi:hypothetical protein